MPLTHCTPVPDPTVLTTAQLLRTVEGLREVIEARLVGVNEGFALLRGGIDGQPQAIADAIRHLTELQNEKFESIRLQFIERDARTAQTSLDSKTAIAAALQAAKEAVGEQNKSSALAIAKSEAATTKQIDQIGKTMDTGLAGLNDKIEDGKLTATALAQRVTASESSGKGVHEGQVNLWGWIVGGVGLIVGLVGGISGLIALLEKIPK